MQIRRFISILSLAMCLVLSLAGFALAAGFSDTRGHWAEEQINKWASSGLAGGYADGTFKPNKEVSRAEFVALTNRAFGIDTKEAAVSFGDVKPNDWYYKDVVAAKTAGYIGGYTDGTFKPNSPITRQEVASILVRLLDIAPTTEGLENFTDATQISDWSRGNIGVVAQKGLMRGMPDNTFMPLKSITRAEAVVSLDRALGYLSGEHKQVEPQLVVNSAIEGRVTLNGQLVKNATVRVFNPGSYKIHKDTKTSSDGYYKLDVKPGYYDITVATDKEVAYQSDIKVTANKVTTSDIALEKAAIIRGILKDSNGQVIKNTTLVFTTNPTFIVVTNNQGEYIVLVAPNRTYTVRAYELGKESQNPVIVVSNLNVGSAGQYNGDTLGVSFSGDTKPTPAGGGGGPVVQPKDITPPVLDRVQYTLNGQSYTLFKNPGNNYNINIPNSKVNNLTELKIIVIEESQTSIQVVGTDISSINIGQVIEDANLKELKPVDGKIIINLDRIAILLILVDFSSYPVGTQKYIEFKLTDASGNHSNFRVVINVVATV